MSERGSQERTEVLERAASSAPFQRLLAASGPIRSGVSAAAGHPWKREQKVRVKKE